jgi:hypothetical protein
MKTSAVTSGAEYRSTADPEGSWIGDRKKPINGSRLHGGRRRRVPHLVLGLLLVAVSTTAFAVISMTAGQRQAVLALAQPVLVGHVLSPPDLREVSIAVDPGVATVSVSEAPRVVGRMMATSLPAGSLLTPGVLGDGSVPSPGRAVAALALKPGQFPPELAPGARVSVVSLPGPTPGTPSRPDSARTWPATAISVTGRANEPVTVVSVELSEADAGQVAAVPAGQVSVVLLAAGGGR